MYYYINLPTKSDSKTISLQQKCELPPELPSSPPPPLMPTETQTKQFDDLFQNLNIIKKTNNITNQLMEKNFNNYEKSVERLSNNKTTTKNNVVKYGKIFVIKFLPKKFYFFFPFLYLRVRRNNHLCFPDPPFYLILK